MNRAVKAIQRDPTPTKIKAVELAIRAIHEARQAKPPAEPKPPSYKPPLTIAEWEERTDLPATLAEETMQRLASDRDHREQMAIVTLRWIGKQLYKAGGVDLMRDALFAGPWKAASFPALSIADSLWNGIGQTKTRPGWSS